MPFPAFPATYLLACPALSQPSTHILGGHKHMESRGAAPGCLASWLDWLDGDRRQARHGKSGGIRASGTAAAKGLPIRNRDVAVARPRTREGEGGLSGRRSASGRSKTSCGEAGLQLPIDAPPAICTPALRAVRTRHVRSTEYIHVRSTVLGNRSVELGVARAAGEGTRIYGVLRTECCAHITEYITHTYTGATHGHPPTKIHGD